MTSSESKKIVQSIGLLVSLIVVACFGQVFVSGTFLQKEKVAVWIFDVGQGDAIFIDAPDGQVLIDGGRNGQVVEKLTAVMPFWDRSIDLVINTHPHADHVNGLNDVLERYSVGEVWADGELYHTEANDYFHELADVQAVARGEIVDLGEGVELEVLWPLVSLEGEQLEDPNAGSVVVLLTYGETTMLFTGDIGEEEETQLIPVLDHIDVLKVAHHGSKYSSAYDFLQKITPDVAVISVGENDYGHPADSVLSRLSKIGALILRTDLDGDVRITTEGGEPKVTTFEL